MRLLSLPHVLRRCGFPAALAFVFALPVATATATAVDPLGPSSRRTSWVISEIHYHPAPRTDARRLEFVEIHNAGLIAEDLGGHRLAGDIAFTVPTNTIVPAGGFVVVAAAPADLVAEYGLPGVLGGFSGRLGNSGTIRFHNPAGALLLEVSWKSESPWPVAPAGAGPSLVLARPSFGEGDPRAWAASAVIGGSPGGPEPSTPGEPQGVVINEILAHTDPPQLDFVELHNTTRSDVNLGGCRITDDTARAGYTIPAGTTLPAGGFLALNQNQLGFALNAAGEALFLFSADGYHVLDAIRFGPQANGIASGRAPGSGPGFLELTQPTPGAANDRPLARDIVISEIMYHPITEDAADQFVEIYNRGSKPVDLGGWRFTDGISFEFPAGTLLAAGAYLAVASDLSRLLTSHPGLDAAHALGNFSGSLSRRGEHLALGMPEDIVATNATGGLTTNRVFIVVSEVTYGDGGQWGQWSDGGGSSLELRDLHSDPREAANWADSDETAKAPWTTVEVTGILDLGSGLIDQLQLIAQGAGAWLVDEVSVVSSGANKVANGSFSSGVGGWVMQGTMAGSRWEPGEGSDGAGSLRVEAVARGDTGGNRIRTALTGSLTPTQKATLRARVRWLRGHPELLLRLRGNYLEAAGRLNLPANTGTPGASNSRATANAGPAIRDLAHSPVLPAAGQNVVVTARITDPDGVGPAVVRYRIDPSASTTDAPLRDDGAGVDAMAHDGIFSAIIPGQASGKLAAFQVLAADAAPMAAATRFPATEALVRWGESKPAGLGTYRLWLTQSNFDRWSNRSKLDNSSVPVTFVYNGERVVHGTGAHFAGSPHISPGYTTPSGALCGYVLEFPADDRFLGATDVVLDWPGRDATAQQEPMAYWIARELGIPFNHRRYVRLHVNGVTETTRGSVYEDAQQVNSDLAESWNPDSPDGELYKIEQWFEFDDGLGTSLVVPPQLDNYLTTGGVKKPARYRWSWLKRAVDGSANDFSSLFTLVDAANATPAEQYPRQLLAFADLDEWMRIFATEHIVVNLDSWGYDIGKNMYAFKPAGGRWQLHMWDIDWVMLASAQHGYSPTSPLMYRGNAVFGDGNRDPAVGRMYNEPAIQRAYWRAINDAVNGPLLPAKVAARMDATHAALVAQGVTRSSGSALTAPTQVKSWLASRRAFLVQQLAGVNSAFALAQGPGTVTGTNLLQLSGTAPITVASLRVNGHAINARWTSVSNWTATLVLAPGSNPLTIEGLDRLGTAVPGSTASRMITYAGAADVPERAVILNEIQYHPAVSGAGFVELYNRSTNTAFDLAGWRLDGAGLDFPEGTLIAPRSLLLVAADRQSLATAHGLSPFVAAEYGGRLLNSGEPLSLLRRGPSPGAEVLVNRVTYSDSPPWPIAADGTGASLQLLDPSLDNRHPGSWTVVPAPAPASTMATPGAPNSANAAGFTLRALWLNELQVDNRTGPRDRAGDRDPWVEIINTSSNQVRLANCHLTDTLAQPTRWPFPPATVLAPGARLVVWLDGEPAESDAAELHAGFRLSPNAGILALVQADQGRQAVLDAIQFNALAPDHVVALLPDGDPDYRVVLPSGTPGLPNTAASQPPVVINEWLAANRATLADPADGDFDDWFELHNPGAVAADLTGYYLSDDPATPRKYTVPAGTVIPPHGFLLVWADEEGAQHTAGGALHVNFKLGQSGEDLILASPAGVVVDHVTFGSQAIDVSEGRWSDGGPVASSPLSRPTPGAPNAPPQGAALGPWITGITLTPAGAVAVYWNTTAGERYRLQATADLIAGPWVDIGAEIAGTGSEKSVADEPPSVGTARFYRIVRLP